MLHAQTVEVAPLEARRPGGKPKQHFLRGAIGRDLDVVEELEVPAI